MRVVAIDPAPGKESTMYSESNGFQPVSGEAMRSTLASIEPTVLLCWDAPLTGPRNPEKVGQQGDFTQRRLESFFRQKETGFKTPKGISVGGYAGLQHWTISRSVLGLPRVGPYDVAYDSLPFHLLPDSAGEVRGTKVARMDRPCVVEIHPAVAAWLWCKEKLNGNERGGTWKYKGRGKDETQFRNQMWKVIRCRCDGEIKESLPLEVESDDEFDAIIGYILGVKWLRGDDDVVLLGDRANGAMLLPRMPDSDLCEAWKKFR